MLYPRTADAAGPQIRHLNTKNARVTAIDAGGYHDLLLVNQARGPVNTDGVVADADLSFVSRGADGVSSYLLQRGRGLTVDGSRQLSASRPVTATVSHTDNGLQARIDADGETRLLLTTGGTRPVSVRVNGEPVSYERVAGAVMLTVSDDAPGRRWAR